jgi:vacuolar protein sorting-associated protein 18
VHFSILNHFDVLFEVMSDVLQVRSEIQTFRNRSVLVSVSEACCACDIALLLRPFYLFPCGHKFHGDCLLAEIQPTLGK